MKVKISTAHPLWLLIHGWQQRNKSAQMPVSIPMMTHCILTCPDGAHSPRSIRPVHDGICGGMPSPFPVYPGLSKSFSDFYRKFSVPTRHLFRADSQPCPRSPHLSDTKPHVLARIIFSTLLSLRMRFAKASVRASLGKNRPLYGSSLSSTTRSFSLADSISRNSKSGSPGSNATPAQ